MVARSPAEVVALAAPAPFKALVRATLKSAPFPQPERYSLSVETWSIIGTTLGTGVVLLGFLLKLWSDTNRRLELLEVSLRAEIHAMRDELKGDLAALREEFHREIGAGRVDTSASI